MSNVVAMKWPDDEQENIDKLAAAIAERLHKMPPLHDTPWTGEECANYFKVEKRTFMERIATHHTFPNPARVPTSDGRRCHPRWYAGEVIEWGKKNRS
jgi:hypothetical protein